MRFIRLNKEGFFPLNRLVFVTKRDSLLYTGWSSLQGVILSFTQIGLRDKEVSSPLHKLVFVTKKDSLLYIGWSSLHGVILFS